MVRLSKKKTFFALCLLSFLISAFVLNRRGVDEVIPLTRPISAAASSAVKTSDSQFLLSARSTPLIKEAASPKSGDNFCVPSNHSVVFLMRIAKCASTSLVELVNSSSKRNKFMFVFNRSGAYNWKQEEIMQVSEVCSRKLARSQELKEFNVKELVVYARHLYFTDFRSLEYTYITFVRDPVSRVASSYFYYHFSHKPGIQQLIPPQHRGENLLDCVRFNHDGCVANLMTKYFCGHDNFCGSGSSEAVNRAKENMKNKFIVIGVMEMMKSSMDLLQLLLPAVFDGTSDLPESNANDARHDLTEEEQYMIRIMNMADYQAELVKDLKEVKLPMRFKYLQRQADKFDQYFFGKLTWVDFAFFLITDLILKHHPTAVDDFPKLKAILTKVPKLPNIKAWIEKRPKTEY